MHTLRLVRSLRWAAIAAGATFAIPGAATATAASTAHAAKFGPRLAACWADLPASGPVVVWVDVDDARAGHEAPPAPISVASARRRARLGLAPADGFDRPLDVTAIATVRAGVERVRATSRFLRSISVEATPAQLTALAALPSVSGLELGLQGRRRPDGGSAPNRTPIDAGPPAAPARAAATGQAVPAAPAAPPYGDSARQLELMRVPELHDRGLTGLGVLIAHFDTGYERFTHQVFRNLRVVAMHDFVDGDSDPTSANDPLESGAHGTMTLSVVGGFRPGTLVGSAFGASFALARTELTSTETAFEEDYWIAALEWADSLGADIVTSSLKFREVETGVGYWWGDMDGATARVTLAAAVAERHGILVFQGAGNDGYNPLHNTLVAPADGIDVVAVGATTMRNTIARFSSCGPTTDPPMRIKPDLVAPGESVWVADVVHDSAYTHVSGTSLSTPLAAGVAALLVSVHRATPAQIRQVMRETASHAATPDVLWGWGMIDAVAAHRALLALFPTDAAWLPVSLQAPEFANPFRPHDAIAFALDAPARVSLRVYDVNGRRVRELLYAPAPAHGLRLRWDGTDNAGRPLPRGTYFVELRAASTAATRKLTLLR